MVDGFNISISGSIIKLTYRLPEVVNGIVNRVYSVSLNDSSNKPDAFRVMLEIKFLLIQPQA